MEHKITIKSKEEFRSFPKGYEVIFDFTDTKTIFLMGRNGCGKSTLVQSIRGNINSNSDEKRKWNAKGVCDTVKEHFDVIIDGFDNVYHLDADGLDNTLSMYNSATAEDFIDLGGFTFHRLSAGERSLACLGALREDVVDSENTLIIFDELDNHLDFDIRTHFVERINKIFPLSKKIIITHDLLMSCICEGDTIMLTSYRDKDDHFKCKLEGIRGGIWENSAKHLLFMLYTNHKIEKYKE